SPHSTFGGLTSLFILAAILIHFLVNSLISSSAFSRGGKASLERWATQLEAAADVGRVAATIHNSEELLPYVVDLIGSRFDFYHVAIYLFTDSRTEVNLKASSSQAGKQLIQTGYSYPVGAQGLIGQVAKTGKPRLSLDSQNDYLFKSTPHLPHTQSEIALPLKAGGNFFGVLDVQSDKKYSFGKEDINSLRVLADQVATAIENTRLFSAANRQLKELTVLHGISLASVEAKSQDDLLTRTTTLIGETLYPHNFGILLLDETGKNLRHHPSYRDPTGVHLPILPLGQGITGMVAATGVPMCVPDVNAETNYFTVDSNTRSELCVPLKINGKVIGVINTESHHHNAFSKNDQRLLSTVAGQVGTALEKLGLAEIEQRRIEELSGLHQITQAFGNMTDVRETYGALAEKLANLIGSKICIVTLYDPESGEMVGQAPGYGISDDKIAQVHYSAAEAKHYWDFRKQGVFRVNHRSQFPVYFDSLLDILNIDSAIVAPAQIEQRILGLVFVANKPGGFTEHDARLLSTFANQAGAVIENSRLYEAAKRQAKELSIALARQEELDHLKSEFIQNVSHELRTPLAIVKGYAELLDSGELGILPDKYGKPLNIIARRTRMLDKLISNLTIMLETQEKVMRKEAVDMQALLHSVINDFEVAATHAGITLSSDIAGEIPHAIGDMELIRRMLDNLLSNALKFTQPEGTVHVQLGRDRRYLLIEVSDTGIGIPKDQLERVFERFYQVDGSASRRYGGTGLGLALVKEIVELHSGEISVKSQANKGSTFRVKLPLYEQSVS
ncbi:MAG: GAF domain-containing protein, partial [Anaerolineae bacterium]|nr:GAF domain-containing protein [Anaerolineae bacterium]